MSTLPTKPPNFNRFFAAYCAAAASAGMNAMKILMHRRQAARPDGSIEGGLDYRRGESVF